MGVGYDWQQKTTKFFDNTQEASAYVNYRINDNNKVNFYMLGGFSNSAQTVSGLVWVHYF